MDGAQECSKYVHFGGFNEAINQLSEVHPSENPERGAVPKLLGLHLFKSSEEQEWESLEPDHTRQA